MQLVANGKLSAAQRSALYFRESGQIVSVGVQNGTSVAKGAVLARLDDSEQRSALESARIERERTRLEYLDVLAGLGYLGKYVEDGQLKSYMVFCRVRDKSKGVKNPLYFASVSIDISPEGEATFGTVNQAPIGV